MNQGMSFNSNSQIDGIVDLNEKREGAHLPRCGYRAAPSLTGMNREMEQIAPQATKYVNYELQMPPEPWKMSN
jgi:hypothetical protein